MTIKKVSSVAGGLIGRSGAYSEKNTLSVPCNTLKNTSPPVQVSVDWQLIEKAQQELQSMSDVDHEKVSVLNRQIFNGEFLFDINQLVRDMKNACGRYS